jgi:virginiamycin B lyase
MRQTAKPNANDPRSRRRIGVRSALLLFGLAAAAGAVSAQTIDTFNLETGSGPGGITAGPDGALWFTEINGDRIGRITTAGVVTEFPLPAGSGPHGITVGSDGALWYVAADAGRIGRITTSGTVTEFPVPTNFGNARIARGSDGNLWYASNQAAVVLVKTSNGVVTKTKLIPTPPGQPNGIAVGPDNRIWFTDVSTTNAIGRIRRPRP